MFKFNNNILDTTVPLVHNMYFIITNCKGSSFCINTDNK